MLEGEKNASSQITDEQLVANYLQGELAAFDTLVQRHLPAVYNFVFKYVHSIPEAEDTAQDAFLKAWKNIRKYDSNYKFKTWLFTIAKNTALDRLKKKGIVPFASLEDGAEEQLGHALVSYESIPEKLIIRLEDAQVLGRAVDQLDQKYRDVVRLYYEKGLNFREIAAFLKKSIDTVKTRHRRALIYIKKEILQKKDLGK